MGRGIGCGGGIARCRSRQKGTPSPVGGSVTGATVVGSPIWPVVGFSALWTSPRLWTGDPLELMVVVGRSRHPVVLAGEAIDGFSGLCFRSHRHYVWYELGHRIGICHGPASQAIGRRGKPRTSRRFVCAPRSRRHFLCTQAVVQEIILRRDGQSGRQLEAGDRRVSTR
jgi:hypothetical protein